MPTATRPSLIHPTATIYPNVELGPGSRVGEYAILGSLNGKPLTIGPNAHIRAHTIIYGGSTIGANLETGHHTLIRSGNTIGENLRIGSYSSLEGGGEIGDYVRIHGRCEMTKGILRDFSRVYGGTYITDNARPPSYDNDLCILEPGSVVMMGCILVAGVRVGLGSVVGAGQVVTADVPDGHLLRRDEPQALRLGDTSRTGWPHGLSRSGEGYLAKIRPENYWTHKYRADYPAEAQDRLAELHERLLAL